MSDTFACFTLKMKAITCFGDRTRSSTFFIIFSVSQIDNFMNVFNTVLHLVVYSLTAAFCTIS